MGKGVVVSVGKSDETVVIRVFQPTIEATNYPFFFPSGLRHFAGLLDEKLPDGSERAVLMGDDPDWHPGSCSSTGDLEVSTNRQANAVSSHSNKRNPAVTTSATESD